MIKKLFHRYLTFARVHDLGWKAAWSAFIPFEGIIDLIRFNIALSLIGLPFHFAFGWQMNMSGLTLLSMFIFFQLRAIYVVREGVKKAKKEKEEEDRRWGRKSLAAS